MEPEGTITNIKLTSILSQFADSERFDVHVDDEGFIHIKLDNIFSEMGRQIIHHTVEKEEVKVSGRSFWD